LMCIEVIVCNISVIFWDTVYMVSFILLWMLSSIIRYISQKFLN